MKKLLLLIGALLSAELTMAQEGTEGRWELGLKAGANNTYIVIDNELNNNEHHDEHFMIKPVGGISVGYKITEDISLMLEGNYSMQGADFDLTEGNGSGAKIGTKEITLNYLAVPLLLKYTGVGETRFAFQIGAQMAFLLSGTEENTFDKSGTIDPSYSGGPRPYTQGTYLLATTDADKEISGPEGTGKFNKKDINLVADIGMEHSFNENTYMSLGLRLAYGFKDIRAEEIQQHPRDLDSFTLRYNVVGGLHLGIHWLL